MAGRGTGEASGLVEKLETAAVKIFISSKENGHGWQ
jgi:hypothetical protein